MKPTVYILDVPEFAGLVESVRGTAGYTFEEVANGYIKISADDELIFHRKAAKFKPAIWYGVFTGGIHGQIVKFDRDSVHIINSVDQ